MASPTVNARSAGRPKANDPVLRDRLLDVALGSFAATGVAATSARSIAADAGVNAALLSYYFGTKAQVVEAVFEERIAPVLARFFQQLLTVEGDIETFAAAFVTGIGEVVDAHPWYPPLWVREVLCDGGALRELMVARVSVTVPLITQRFADAQRAGEMNADLDPAQMIVSLLGLSLVPAAGAPLWQATSGERPVSTADRTRHVLSLLKQGLL
jgi:AcrR family transcriptional regulator